jgi:glycosyltransferase involved in cell wall biosynthesis
MYKVVFFGTHPKQFNGYSKVTYELIHEFAKRKDIEFIMYGFQNFFNNPSHRVDLPSNVQIYDAFKVNKETNGFGIKEVTQFVRTTKPDMCIIFNDANVIMRVMEELLKIPKDERTFKIVPYLDQVYLNQKKAFVKYINENADACILFTKYWENVFKSQGCTIPTFNLPHGFNSDHIVKIPKEKAREALGMSNDDFVILNLNRNQPRKRWDVCLKAFARVIEAIPNKPIKLFIGTDLKGSWDLIEILEREFVKCGMSAENVKKHVIILQNPRILTDEDVNIMYNACDIGINTCDGEGFGLCNFDQAGLGVPQVVPDLGGFKEFFEDGVTALMMEPIISLYNGSEIDGVGGETLITSYKDYADAILDYYRSPEMMAKHGDTARKNIIENYTWKKISDKLVDIVTEIMGGKKVPPPSKEPLLPKGRLSNMIKMLG